MDVSGERLHPVQDKILKLLIANIDDPLTIREIRERSHVSSTSVVVHHISQLEKKGYLKRNPADPRDYVIVKGGPEKAVAYLPVYGLAQCGPGGSILDGNPVARIPISTRLLTFQASEAFMVRAKGDSMLPKIQDKDYVIARKAKHPTSGGMYVCVNDGRAQIKKVRIDGKKYILESLNRDKHPPFLAAGDFRVEGEVRGVVSTHIE